MQFEDVTWQDLLTLSARLLATARGINVMLINDRAGVFAALVVGEEDRIREQTANNLRQVAIALGIAGADALTRLELAHETGSHFLGAQVAPPPPEAAVNNPKELSISGLKTLYCVNARNLWRRQLAPAVNSVQIDFGTNILDQLITGVASRGMLGLSPRQLQMLELLKAAVLRSLPDETSNIVVPGLDNGLIQDRVGNIIAFILEQRENYNEVIQETSLSTLRGFKWKGSKLDLMGFRNELYSVANRRGNNCPPGAITEREVRDMIIRNVDIKFIGQLVREFQRQPATVQGFGARDLVQEIQKVIIKNCKMGEIGSTSCMADYQADWKTETEMANLCMGK